ncbi:MAG: gliding motility-associated ABC transporter ATP-binding subunit GldA [Bacteroidales bacterium]|nr:gliding motility-associated ABC transporter ATP-binding subunit GldA [Bacteroidales bacterium]MCF8333303.1 gliding motility-associated ABC transporter ATP-binding subunit GldA [Bacteroidales bacterium]
MSIEIGNISKYYGEQKALDGVNLTINSGEVAGLVGPNGAGKSTLMKIITCFIPPSEGQVHVNGLSVSDQSIDVRKQIGYLPENNPLYDDMYVREYLNFVAGIRKIKDPGKRIEEIIETTGLTPEQNKKISNLSKGYKQRTGVAQALLSDPDVLILDEPTAGLDPNQLVEIRNLIKNVGKEKTILLSTHIMQEVEAVCDRVIIINNGQVVADEAPENISKERENAIITVEFDKDIKAAELKAIKGVRNVKQAAPTTWVIESDTGVDIRSALFQLAVKKEITILSLNKEAEKLEEVFHRLTQNKK